MQKRLISIVTPCYNEEANVHECYKAIKTVFDELPNYQYEHIFIDNNSRDRTVEILKEIAKADKNVKIIVNVRNFGQVRSPYYGILQSSGDAVIPIPADLQDPPSLIKKFIKNWEDGNKIVIGVKNQSEEGFLMFGIRKIFYRLIEKISEVDHIKNFTGYGLYDREFINIIKKLNDPYPYFRGMVAELGFERVELKYIQQKRKKGKTSNNFFSLYDVAMLGFVNHSKLPLRIASFTGFTVAFLSLLIALIYFVLKIADWNEFDLGLAPLVIGLFFFSAIQLVFIGIIGEYIGAIYTQVKNRPLVIEKERINF